MKWEEYSNNNPALAGNGFWTEVPYFADSTKPFYTKGFIAVQEARIIVIGHVWFPYVQPPGAHFYLFEGNGNIFSENRVSHPTNRNHLGGRPKKINADLSDKLVYLATGFREKHPEYSFSLDNCMRQVLRLTGRR
jgi:hypothetical protein